MAPSCSQLPTRTVIWMTARSLLEAVSPGVRAAATCFDGLLVVRWIGAPAHHLRRDYARFWSGFRSHAAGLPARLPRLWDL